MCRYAITSYKHHFVCVPCRRSVKRHTPDSARSAVDVLDAASPRGVRCGDCGQPMVRMGRDFRPPRRDDRRAWEVVAALVDAGIGFDSCGCDGPGWRPATPAELRTVRRDARRHQRDLATQVRTAGRPNPRLERRTAAAAAVDDGIIARSPSRRRARR